MDDDFFFEVLIEWIHDISFFDFLLFFEIPLIFEVSPDLYLQIRSELMVLHPLSNVEHVFSEVSSELVIVGYLAPDFVKCECIHAAHYYHCYYRKYALGRVLR